mmetsp:Transcript_66701/g.195055  ORF Transcript_66701/g.195055 Transcript_66701/m.195055 type:complete len:112 (-) Transcript_66701:173-508(-)
MQVPTTISCMRNGATSCTCGTPRVEAAWQATTWWLPMPLLAPRCCLRRAHEPRSTAHPQYAKGMACRLTPASGPRSTRQFADVGGEAPAGRNKDALRRSAAVLLDENHEKV